MWSGVGRSDTRIYFYAFYWERNRLFDYITPAPGFWISRDRISEKCRSMTKPSTNIWGFIYVAQWMEVSGSSFIAMTCFLSTFWCFCASLMRTEWAQHSKSARNFQARWQADETCSSQRSAFDSESNLPCTEILMKINHRLLRDRAMAFFGKSPTSSAHQISHNWTSRSIAIHWTPAKSSFSRIKFYSRHNHSKSTTNEMSSSNFSNSKL